MFSEVKYSQKYYPFKQRWLGHVERSSEAVRTACDLQIDGRRGGGGGAGTPRLTWKKLTEKDCCEWKLTTVNPQERCTLISGVRSAMCAPARQSKI